MNIKYFLIHGLDRKRRIFMQAQIRHMGIPQQDVMWINGPNVGDELPDGLTTNPNLTRGQVAITHKHYLCLKEIVENNYEIGVIMEDNIEFLSNVTTCLNRYLKDLPSDWDMLFDSDFFGWKYIEGPISLEMSVYKKSNNPLSPSPGAAKGAHFLMISNRAAKILYANFLPFNEVSDHYYDYLIRKFNLNTYWAEPSNVHKIQRQSTWL